MIYFNEEIIVLELIGANLEPLWKERKLQVTMKGPMCTSLSAEFYKRTVRLIMWTRQDLSSREMKKGGQIQHYDIPENPGDAFSVLPLF